MQRFFSAIYSFANRRKFFSVALFVALFAVLGFFASRIGFSEDITNLIPANDKSDITAKVLKQMNFADKISVVISTDQGTPEEMTAFAGEFLDSLETKCKPYVGKVQGRIDEKNIQETFEFIYKNLPLFLDKTDYAAIDNKLQHDSIAKIVANDYKSLISPAGIVSRNFILQDPLGISFLALKKMQQLSIGDHFALQDGFVVTKDHKNLLLFITPKLAANETDQNTIFINKFDAIAKNLNSKYKSKATLRYFGATPVAVANATQIKSDVHTTSLIAAIVLILILTFFYRSITTPILIFIPSLFGAAFALAVLYFTKGTISAISLGISSILLGETTDYSIYVLTHLRDNKNVKVLYKDISKPLILCGTTTAISFLCLYFVKSEALKDLGVFAALSVIATSVFSLVLIPLLYKANEKLRMSDTNFIDKLGFYSYHKNKILVFSLAALLIACCFTYSKVTFNNDLSALNYVPKELKSAEIQLEKIADGASKSLYLAVYGNSQEAVLESNNKLFTALEKESKAGKIVNFSSIGGMVFSKEEQQKKIAEWNAFWNDAKKARTKSELVAAGSPYGFKANTFSGFYETLDKPFQAISISDYAKVSSFFLSEFVSEKNGFYTISTLVKVPAENRDAFVNKIKSQPNITVIDRVQTNETFLGSLKQNFEKLIDYSLIAIFFILLFAFRRIELVIVTIIPILVSWMLTTGLMGMFGIQFNIINIIVCTLIFGIGVDYSIFMTAGLQKERTNGKTALPTYKSSILLSVSTTILGIGVLVFAQHPALRSIAVIAIIGIFSAVLVSFVIQPIVFDFIVTNRVKKGKPPYEIKRFVHSSLSFIYYGLGGFLISIISVTLMKILPLPKKKKQHAFHYLFSKFAWSVLLSYPSAKRKIIRNNETFDKPAIIIANHNSFLDILAIAMLSPKIVFLVSDWVYNSPIFGKGVRLAGFYPVSNGIDNGVDHLREKVEQGFSLMVFPEGTRSIDNTVKRFHKGAFYLAEKLQLDIIPILIHGYSEVLPKGDFMINGGKTTVQILDRITPNDTTYGNDYAERTKKLSVFFKTRHHAMRRELEGPEYFRKAIVNSFDYKERQVIREMKLQLDANLETYHQLNSWIRPKVTILHLADDFGQFDLLLALQEPQRKVISWIADEEKRAVAKNNHIVKTRTIGYVDTIKDIGKFDLVLISAGVNAKTIESICKSAENIILIGNSVLKAALLNFGFSVTAENHNLIALKKD